MSLVELFVQQRPAVILPALDALRHLCRELLVLAHPSPTHIHVVLPVLLRQQRLVLARPLCVHLVEPERDLLAEFALVEQPQRRAQPARSLIRAPQRQLCWRHRLRRACCRLRVSRVLLLRRRVGRTHGVDASWLAAPHPLAVAHPSGAQRVQPGMLGRNLAAHRQRSDAAIAAQRRL
eukprot:358981-Rhodomonas_salina.1